jgi:rhodanese-related sulfurtransferase
MLKSLLALILGVVFTATPLLAASVPTVTKEELKSMLGNEEVVVLDVRAGRDWSTSEFKIEGAVRVDGQYFSALDAYSKDMTFVLYCA